MTPSLANGDFRATTEPIFRYFIIAVYRCTAINHSPNNFPDVQLPLPTAVSRICWRRCTWRCGRLAAAWYNLVRFWSSLGNHHQKWGFNGLVCRKLYGKRLKKNRPHPIEDIEDSTSTWGRSEHQQAQQAQQWTDNNRSPRRPRSCNGRGRQSSRPSRQRSYQRRPKMWRQIDWNILTHWAMAPTAKNEIKRAYPIVEDLIVIAGMSLLKRPQNLQ